MKSLALASISYVVFVVTAASAAEVQVLSDPVIDQDKITLDFRLWDADAMDGRELKSDAVAVKETTVKIKSGDAEMKSDFVPFTKIDGVKSEVALLIDLSAPQAPIFRRRNDWEIKHAKTLLTPNAPIHNFGVFTIEKDTLTEIAPLGSGSGFALRKLAEYRPQGQTTQIFKLTGMVIEELKTHKADRKFLVIFSDGDFEDQGGFEGGQFKTLVDETTKKAKEAGVVIIGLGYSANEDRSNLLQTLEELARPTKGLYKRADYGSYTFPQNFERDFFYPFVESGGRLTADVSELPAGTHTLVLELENEKGETITHPLQLEVKDTGPASVPPEPEKKSQTLLYIIIGAVVLAIAVLGLILSRLARREDEEVLVDEDYDTIPVAPQFSANVYGWLEMLDADGSREQIDSTNLRIGRGSDNDFVLRNDSVSITHCVLSQGRDGAWTVTDLDSGNGVYLNGKRVDQAALRDGDTIELGEVKMRFRAN